jgi:uncharacterized protein YkwD
MYRPLSHILCAAALIMPGAAFASGLEGDVLAELNFARAHPQDYAEELRRYRDSFEGNIAYLPDEPDPQATREGVRAVDEAIAFLDRQRPLPPLESASVLQGAAEDQADDQGPSGRIGHVSPGGRSVGQRVQRRGGGIYVSETISYGHDRAAGVVRQLVIDDGVRTRGHRAIIFQPWLRFAGVGCGRHAVYGHMCVIDFSQTEDGRPAYHAQAESAD